MRQLLFIHYFDKTGMLHLAQDPPNLRDRLPIETFCGIPTRDLNVTQPESALLNITACLTCHQRMSEIREDWDKRSHA